MPLYIYVYIYIYIYIHTLFQDASPGYFPEVLGALLRGEAPEQLAKFVAMRVQLEDSAGSTRFP